MNQSKHGLRFQTSQNANWEIALYAPTVFVHNKRLPLTTVMLTEVYVI